MHFSQTTKLYCMQQKFPLAHSLPLYVHAQTLAFLFTIIIVLIKLNDNLYKNKKERAEENFCAMQCQQLACCRRAHTAKLKWRQWTMWFFASLTESNGESTHTHNALSSLAELQFAFGDPTLTATSARQGKDIISKWWNCTKIFLLFLPRRAENFFFLYFEFECMWMEFQAATCRVQPHERKQGYEIYLIEKRTIECKKLTKSTFQKIRNAW